MNKYSSIGTPQILHRFHNFDDALVRDVHLVIALATTSRTATITLEARDIEAEPDEAWRKVVLEVRGLTEYRLVENERENSYVLSLGLKFDCFDGVLFFDFGPNSDEPDSVEDFRGSSFYLAGKDCSWEVKAYPKSWIPKARKSASRSGLN